MRQEILKFYTLKKSLQKAGVYETPGQLDLIESIKAHILEGGLISLSGMVGSGKTMLLAKLSKNLRSEGKIIVSQLFATEKKRVNVSTLYTALFCDLATDPDFKHPKTHEIRDRALAKLFSKLGQPVVLFIDEAHDLNHEALRTLKILIETAQREGGMLSILLAGHPKLGNDLNNTVLEEVGARCEQLSLDDCLGSRVKYVEWLLKNCKEKGIAIHDIFTKESIELLSEKLITPLQLKHYMQLALKRGYQANIKPITPDIINNVILAGINGMEASLARHGYHLPTICSFLAAKPYEVRTFLSGGQMNLQRKKEFIDKIQHLGVVATG